MVRIRVASYLEGTVNSKIFSWGKKGVFAMIWLDVSTINHWSGKPIGIPRVAYFLAKGLLSAVPEIRFCEYKVETQSFFEVDIELVKMKLAHREGEAVSTTAQPLANKINNIRRLVRKLLKPAWRIIDAIAGSWGHVVRVKIKDFLRAAVKFIKVFIFNKSIFSRGLKHSQKECGYKPASFNSGDVLILAGMGWAYQGYSETIWEVKTNSNIKIVSLLYDVIPCIHPNFFRPEVSVAFENYVLNLLWASSIVITISQNSKLDIIGFGEAVSSPVPPIEVVRLGDSIPAETLRKPQALSELESFILCVGTIEVRKNHQLLYHVWNRMVESAQFKVPKLVVVGRIGLGVDDLRQQIATNRNTKKSILLLESIDDTELAWLYRNCLFTVHPSFYEGWGLPIAESLQYGKVCVASRSSSMPEVGGDLVFYEDPFDLVSWERRLRSLIVDPSIRLELEKKIREKYSIKNWDNFSRDFIRAVTTHFTLS